MKALIDTYIEVWNEFNLFGRIVIFPILVVFWPVFWIVELGVKE